MSPQDRPVTVTATGDTAAVTLPETPTSGYRWHLVDPAGGIVVESSEWVPGDPGTAGSAGGRTFRLRLAAGVEPVALTFVLRQPWDDDAVVDRCTVRVERPPG